MGARRALARAFERARRGGDARGDRSTPAKWGHPACCRAGCHLGVMIPPKPTSSLISLCGACRAAPFDRSGANVHCASRPAETSAAAAARRARPRLFAYSSCGAAAEGGGRAWCRRGCGEGAGAVANRAGVLPERALVPSRHATNESWRGSARLGAARRASARSAALTSRGVASAMRRLRALISGAKVHCAAWRCAASAARRASARRASAEARRSMRSRLPVAGLRGGSGGGGGGRTVRRLAGCSGLDTSLGPKPGAPLPSLVRAEEPHSSCARVAR